MTIYEDYYTRYRAMITREKLKHPEHTHVIKDYIYIAVTFLEDRKVQPWEQEAMKQLVDELKQKNEVQMLEAIKQTIKDLDKDF